MWFKSNKKKIEEELNFYFPPRIKEESRQPTPELHPNVLERPERILSVSSTNITGYVSICEKLELRDLKIFMDKYFDLIVGTIQKYEGNVDQINGDVISSFWGLYSSISDTARLACQCALAQIKNMEEVFYPWAKERSFPTPQIRIGISTGELLIASTGGEGFYQFSPLGVVVNSASILCDHARSFDPPILIDETTGKVIKDFKLEENISIEFVDDKTINVSHLIQKSS